MVQGPQRVLYVVFRGCIEWTNRPPSPSFRRLETDAADLHVPDGQHKIILNYLEEDNFLSSLAVSPQNRCSEPIYHRLGRASQGAVERSLGTDAAKRVPVMASKGALERLLRRKLDLKATIYRFTASVMLCGLAGKTLRYSQR